VYGGLSRPNLKGDDQNGIIGRLYNVMSRAGKLGIIKQPPQKDMGIKQVS
jgi:hypothetical protein